MTPSAPALKRNGKHRSMLANLASVGGRARAEQLSPRRRVAIARKAARARWRKHATEVEANRVRVWETPPEVFEPLDDEFHFTLDAAASDTNAKCRRYYTKEQDGLAQPWAPERVWCSPPYDSVTLHLWMKKAYQESLLGALVVMLVPVRTDADWWHGYVEGKAEARFLPGRVKFTLGSIRRQSPIPIVAIVFRTAK